VNPAYQASELKYVVEQAESEAIYFADSYRGNPMRSRRSDIEST